MYEEDPKKRDGPVLVFDMFRMMLDKVEELGVENQYLITSLVATAGIESERYLRSKVQPFVDEGCLQMPHRTTLGWLQCAVKGKKLKKAGFRHSKSDEKHKRFEKEIDKIIEWRNDAAHGKNVAISYEQARWLLDFVQDLISVRLEVAFTFVVAKKLDVTYTPSKGDNQRP